MGEDITAEGDGILLKNNYILGVRMKFLRRSHSEVRITPPEPVHLDGGVKGFEVYALGRSVPHKLYVVIRDRRGRDFRLYLGTLDFQGWSKLRAYVPQNVEHVYYMDGFAAALNFVGFY